MKKLPKLWRKKKGGRLAGNYFISIDGRDVNLGTSDANEAEKRRAAAVKNRRRNFPDELNELALADEQEAARVADESSQGGTVPGGAHNPDPGGATPPPATNPAPAAPAALPPMPSTSDAQAEAAATAAAAAETTGGPAAGDAPIDPDAVQITNEDLAKLGIEAQVALAAWRARSRVYQGFIPPPLPPEARAPLTEQWQKIITYANLGAVLPPWVTGLVIPGVTLVTATVAMAAAYEAIAEEQRKAAGAPAQKPPENTGAQGAA
jgi:hypothetical protein